MLACAVVATVTEASIGTGVLNQFQLKPFITSMLTLTLATNVITTCMFIAIRFCLSSHVFSIINSSHLVDSITHIPTHNQG